VLALFYFEGTSTPENAENLINEFPGLRTITIQSSLRYDYDRHKTVELVKKIRPVYASPRRLFFSPEEVDEILLLIGFLYEALLKNILSHYKRY